jgi:type I restriction enzyme R subunit
MSEAKWKTRKERIDKKLRSLGQPWQIVRWKDGLNMSVLTCHAVEEFSITNGLADYSLFVNGQMLGILEAKIVSVKPQNVLEQAKRYAPGAFQSPGNWHGLRASCSRTCLSIFPAQNGDSE